MKVVIKISENKSTTCQVWRDASGLYVIGHNQKKWLHSNAYGGSKCGYYYVATTTTELDSLSEDLQRQAISVVLGIDADAIQSITGEITNPGKPGRPAASAPKTTDDDTHEVTPAQPTQTNPTAAGQILDPIANYIAAKVEETVTRKVMQTVTPRIEEIASNAAPKTTTHIIKVNDAAPVEIEGTLHAKFTDIVTMVKLGIMPYLYGPAGTGKSTIAEQVAKALNLDFYPISAVQDPSEIFGRTTADGTYIPSPFYNAFTKGGLVLFDEIDGSLPDVLIKANQALANRVADFPIVGTIHAHENFRLIATANTIGQGQSLQYNGRFAQDAALMNRFGALVYIGYDEQIELASAANNSELVEFVHKLRELAEQKAVNLVVTCREIRNVTTLTANGMAIADALRYTILNRIGIDDQNKLINSMPYNGNQFCETFARL